MKFRAISLVVLATAFTPLTAQEAEEGLQDLPKWKQEFLNLDESSRTKFDEHLKKAQELFGEERIFEAVDELREAKSIFDMSPDVDTLLGACQVEFRAFDQAMEHFRDANDSSPNTPNVIFNMGEVYFVTDRWEQAAAQFDRVIELINEMPAPKNAIEAAAPKQLDRLSNFKLLICHLKMEKMEEAKKLAARYDENDDSPYHYYAAAVMALHEDDQLLATQEMARATRIFQDPRILSPFKDSLMESGYLEGPTGHEIFNYDEDSE